MNDFLHRYAQRNRKLGLSATWVLPLSGSGKQPVAAYYTLASSTVSREEIPAKRSLPGYPVPVVLLARLAVHRQFQGQGVGEKTLVTALRQSVALVQRGLPALGLVLDVIDDRALSFYQTFDLFQPFTDDPLRLFVPMSVLEQI
jgi:GNAT superfamily N-acetyltransferase